MYSQEISHLELLMGTLLGIVAAFLGITLVYSLLRLAGLDYRAGLTVAALITLVWVLWPSRKKEQG